MKFSVSLSAVLAILPALVAAASPLDSRSNGDMYFPRHHARHFGRQRQGAFGGGRQGAGNRTGQGQQSASASGKNKSQSSTSVASPPANGAASTTAATVAANNAAASTTAAAVAANNAAASTTAAARGGNKNKHGGGNQSTAAAAASTTDAASTDSASSVDTTSSTDTATVAASGTSSAAAATTSDASVAAASGNNNSNPDTSLNLLPELVATGLELTGQETPTAGQVASLTSKNNFINFCAGKTITNGAQVTTGSCDPIPMGDIIPKANMPAAKFTNPINFSTIPANQPFTISMALNNLQAGVFTNAQKTYYMAPQQLNNNKILIGHTHVVIQPMGSDFAAGDILDPATFTFFKGINTGQDGNGIVTADVTAGVPPGNYRLASINTDANHAPAVVAVAQHGCLDDMIYFTAK